MSNYAFPDSPDAYPDLLYPTSVADPSYGDLTYGSGTYGDPFSTPPTVGAPPIAASDRFAAYKVEVAWSTNIPGVAILDLSTLGGADTLGDGSVAYVLKQFGGPYDDITARSDNRVRTESVTWTYGRSDDFSEMQALNATITGRDPTGMMNVHNPNSPLNQNSLLNGSLKPLRPVRVTCTYKGNTFPILFGFLRSLDYEPQGRTGTFTMEVTDLFAFLETPQKDQPNSGVSPTIPYVSPVTTGQAIGKVLDYIGWSDPNMRSLDDGDQIPFFEADGTKTGLGLIADLVQASLGLFYIDPSGVAVYADRNHRFTSPVKAGFVNTMRAVGSGFAIDTVKNKWTVKKQNRTAPGQYTDGPEQVASDFPSAHQYGERSEVLSSPYFLTDEFAFQVAGQLIAATKDPINPLWRLSVDNRTAELMQQMLTLGLLDRVSVTEAATGTQGTFFVEQISGSIAGHKHTVSYLLSDRSAVALATLDPFILGTDVLDSPKVLGF